MTTSKRMHTHTHSGTHTTNGQTIVRRQKTPNPKTFNMGAYAVWTYGDMINVLGR